MAYRDLSELERIAADEQHAKLLLGKYANNPAPIVLWIKKINASNFMKESTLLSLALKSQHPHRAIFLKAAHKYSTPDDIKPRSKYASTS